MTKSPPPHFFKGRKTGFLLFQMTILIMLSLFLPEPSMANSKVTKKTHNLPLLSVDPVNAQKYSQCITLASRDPTAALSEAMAWATKNGGEPASHCIALAMISLHDFSSGAEKLEHLAQSSRYSNRIKAGLFDQAAQAWLLARDSGKALDDLNKALHLVPDAPDLWIDRSMLFAAQENYDSACADLDRAIQLAPNRVDSLTLRASARRYLAEYDGAKADIEAALKVNPGYQEAWLEQGFLCFHDGDYFGAYEAFSKTVSLDPESEAASVAKENLVVLINGLGIPVEKSP